MGIRNSFFEKASNIIKTNNNKNIFLSKINFIEEKDEILSQIKKLETDFNNQFMINKINLTTHEKDFSEACFKYDKIISDNLLVSGLIGISCKFPNLKEYILSNKEEVSINSLEIKKLAMELKEYKNKLESIYENMKFQLMTMKNNFQAFMQLKTDEMNKKYEEFEKTMTEKIHILNIKNNGLVESLKEKEEKMINGVKFIEKIKEEAIENNNNTIHIISKDNKNVANQLIQAKKEFKSLKKNIIDLSTLLIKKDSDKNNKNKEAVINSFNDMMSELIKETFIKEKKNEFNYNNFNLNNNNFPSLVLSNNDNYNYINENNRPNQLKIRSLTHNISKDLNEEDKRMSIKLKLNFNNNRETKIKSKFSKDNNNNNLNNKKIIDNNNGEKDELINMKELSKSIRSSFTFKNKKFGKALERNDNNKKEIKKERNLTIDNLEKINKNENNYKNITISNFKNNKTEIDNKEYLKENEKSEIFINEKKKGHNDKDNDNDENIIIISEKEENQRDNIEEGKIGKEDNKSGKKEDKNNEKKENDESDKDKDEETKKNFIDEENSDKETEKKNNNPNIDKQSLNNEKTQKINNNNHNKAHSSHSNPKSESFRFDSNNLKSLENPKSLLTQNINNNYEKNKRLFNNIKNMKQIKISNINENKAGLSKGLNNNRRSQTSKKDDLPLTKNIFSLYNYLRSTKNANNFKNNKTEDIDYSYIKQKEKKDCINQGNIHKKIVSKDVLEKIKVIKDEDIIDKPLLCNQENFEVRRCDGDIEKKLIHLEFFVKKKLDELVREIKIFIPIHFNSHTRDYNILEKK